MMAAGGPNSCGIGLSEAKNKPPVCFRRRAVMTRSGGWGTPPLSFSLRPSSLGLTVLGRRRTLLVLRHELVELVLVLGVAQAVQEHPEFGLLLFETLQRFHA